MPETIQGEAGSTQRGRPIFLPNQSATTGFQGSLLQHSTIGALSSSPFFSASESRTEGNPESQLVFDLGSKEEFAKADTSGQVRAIFEKLTQKWKERPPILSITEGCTLPEYQEIIGLGMPAVPLILRELISELDHWFWALSVITRENPVSREAEGNLEAMRDAWLEWGRRHTLA